MQITPYDLASRFTGIKEVSGNVSNPQILAMLKLDHAWPQDDKVPWCSAFMNYIAWLLRLPRSKSLMARSWLLVGRPVEEHIAKPGWDIVILSRDADPKPAHVIDAPGHVGFYAGPEYTSTRDAGCVWLLGGNQNDTVSIQKYPFERVLGIRSIRPTTR